MKTTTTHTRCVFVRDARSCGNSLMVFIFLCMMFPNQLKSQTIADPGNMTSYRGNNYTSYDILITIPSTQGSLWGYQYYTDDSQIASAARHYYNLTSAGSQYVVRVVVYPGLSSYSSATGGGFTSSSYGAWGGSYYFSTYWAATFPSVTTSSATSVTYSSANVPGSISGTGSGSSITSRGICYNTSGSPTVADSKTSNGSGTGSFTGNLSDLSGSQTYYARAYAINNLGQTAYGSQRNFTTHHTPEITVSGSLSAMSSSSGTPSSAQHFTVSGDDLVANVTVTAPTGFEVSTSSGSGYTSSLSLVPSGDDLSSTYVYVRLSSSATGNPSGNVSLSSTGATTQNVSASGTVTTLPIELIKFTAINTDKGIQLDWQTASERDNDYFTIETSDNAKDFTKLTEVDGAGNSNSLLSYETVDTRVSSGIRYYRLKQTDYDGNFSYSETISIIAQNTVEHLSVSRLAVHNDELSFILRGESGIYHAEIIDPSGQCIVVKTLELRLPEEIKSLQLSPAVKGIHILKISNGSQSTSIKFNVSQF